MENFEFNIPDDLEIGINSLDDILDDEVVVEEESDDFFGDKEYDEDDADALSDDSDPFDDE